MVLSIGEKSSTPDKGKLFCLHTQGLAFQPVPLIKGKNYKNGLQSPPPPPTPGGTAGERSTCPKRKKYVKKNGGALFSSFGVLGGLRGS